MTFPWGLRGMKLPASVPGAQQVLKAYLLHFSFLRESTFWLHCCCSDQLDHKKVLYENTRPLFVQRISNVWGGIGLNGHELMEGNLSKPGCGGGAFA